MSKRSVKRYLQDILTAIEKIMPYLSKSSNRERPRIYQDHQIISMLIIMEVFSLSFRETIILSRDYFKNAPSLRDFHHRASRLKHVIQILIKFIHDIDSIIVDETGIGFKKKARLNWKRGTEVRKVKGHIRCEVVMTKGRYKMIQYVEVGKRYSLEIKMLREILKGVDLSGERFLADRLYDVRWLREYLRDRGIRGFFPTTCVSHIFCHLYITFFCVLSCRHPSLFPFFETLPPFNTISLIVPHLIFLMKGLFTS